MSVLNYDVNQIDTDIFNDKTFLGLCFQHVKNFKRESDIRVTYENLFKKQHLIITKMLIPFCKNSNERYHLNLMMIISILYNIYIESEVYKLPYGNQQNYSLQM